MCYLKEVSSTEGPVFVAMPVNDAEDLHSFATFLFAVMATALYCSEVPQNYI